MQNSFHLFSGSKSNSKPPEAMGSNSKSPARVESNSVRFNGNSSRGKTKGRRRGRKCSPVPLVGVRARSPGDVQYAGVVWSIGALPPTQPPRRHLAFFQRESRPISTFRPERDLDSTAVVPWTFQSSYGLSR